MNTRFSTVSTTPGGTDRYVSWGLRILAALVFLAAGGAKLAAAPAMVAIFDQLGIGQWFRTATGLVEIAGAVALVVPATAAFGGLFLATTMVFAVLTHLFVIGGSPVPALVLLAVTATVAWLHRASLLAAFQRLRKV